MSHRYRLYPEPAQEEILLRHCRDSRDVWNMALEQCEHARRIGRYADQKLWDRQLAEARQFSPANADINAALNIAAGQVVSARGGTVRSRPPDEARTTPEAEGASHAA